MLEKIKFEEKTDSNGAKAHFANIPLQREDNLGVAYITSIMFPGLFIAAKKDNPEEIRIAIRKCLGFLLKDIDKSIEFTPFDFENKPGDFTLAVKKTSQPA